MIHEADEKLLRLYRLNNTDELQWKTITYMEEEMEKLHGDDDEHSHEYATKYSIISGMGRGVYVINLDFDKDVSFQTKITVESGAARITYAFISLLVFAFIIW